MAYTETIALEHPETCEEVELTITFGYCKEQRPTMDDPGSPEEFEIHEVQDKHGNYYADELVWTDDQVIEGIKHAN